MEVPVYAQQVLAACGESVDGGGTGAVGAGTGVDSSLGLGETMSRFMPINYRQLSTSPPPPHFSPLLTHSLTWGTHSAVVYTQMFLRTRHLDTPQRSYQIPIRT